MLFETVVEKYMSDKRKRLRRCTIAGYESSIRTHLTPRWSGVEVESITAEDIQEWIESIEQPGAAAKAYKTLRQIIRWSIRKLGMRIYDPTSAGIDLPTIIHRKPSVLDASQAKALLRCLWDTDVEAVAICSITLGLRRGEACGLKWNDIDLRTGEVRIRRSRQMVGGEEVVELPKTEKSARSCWLPKFALKRLRQIKKGSTGWLCALSPDAIARHIRSHCKRAGVASVSMTNMRHTWATMAVEAGVGIEVVAMMLGHTNITTAYEHYIVPRKHICQDAQRSVERLLLRA